jgi:peptide/nickel transport system substrate-binding protein
MLEWLIGLDGAKLAPSIAERWEISSNGLMWTFYIRKNVKFQNGEDLTADDVQYSLNRYITQPTVYADMKNDVDHMEIVDPYTLRIYTKGPLVYFAHLLSPYTPGYGIITPKDYIEKNGAAYFEAHPVGTGPFKFVRHVPGDQVEYQAWNGNWRVVPAFKTLTTILVPEESTRIAMIKTGAVDLIEVSLDGAEDLEKAGLRSAALNFHSNFVDLFGAYSPQAISAKLPITDVRVRQALSLAINRDEIMSTFFAGKAIPVGPALITEQNVADVDLPYWMDQAKKVYNHYDPDQAKQLLSQAGYANGFSIKLYTYTMSGASYLPKLAEIVQGYWGKIGVKVEVVPVDQGAMTPVQNVLKSPFMIGAADTHRSMPRPVTPTTLSDYYYGSTAAAHAQAGLAFPEVNTLFDHAAGEMDQTKRQGEMNQIVKTIADAYVTLMISQVPSMAGIGPRVDINYPNPTDALPMFVEYAKHRQP